MYAVVFMKIWEGYVTWQKFPVKWELELRMTRCGTQNSPHRSTILFHLVPNQALSRLPYCHCPKPQFLYQMEKESRIAFLLKWFITWCLIHIFIPNTFLEHQLAFTRHSVGITEDTKLCKIVSALKMLKTQNRVEHVPKIIQHINQCTKYGSQHLFHSYCGPDKVSLDSFHTLNNAMRSVLWLSLFYKCRNWYSNKEYLGILCSQKNSGHDFSIASRLTFQELPEKNQWLHSIYGMQMYPSKPQMKAFLLSGLQDATGVYALRH